MDNLRHLSHKFNSSHENLNHVSKLLVLEAVSKPDIYESMQSLRFGHVMSHERRYSNRSPPSTWTFPGGPGKAAFGLTTDFDISQPCTKQSRSQHPLTKENWSLEHWSATPSTEKSDGNAGSPMWSTPWLLRSHIFPSSCQ